MGLSYRQKQMFDTALAMRDRQFENEIEKLRGEIQLKDLHIKHLEERLELYARHENNRNTIILETR